MPAPLRLRSPAFGGTLFGVSVTVVLALVLLPVALGRLVDGDEGFYLVAARLVAEGNHPYRDFFFPQMPLAPWAYGAWFRVVGHGWEEGRILAAFWGVCAGLVLVREARRRTGSRGWAVVALGFFLTSGQVLGWFTVAKTYGLAAFLLLAGAALVQRPALPAAFGGGLLLALAAETRLYLLVALPCAGLYLWRDHGDRRRLAALAAGAVAAALLVLPAALRDPQAFYFGNVTFHVLRNAEPTAAPLHQKLGVLADLVLLRTAERTESLQLVGLIILAAASARSSLTPRNRLGTYLWVALFFASLLPSPMYAQYFCLLVPFLILDAVALLAAVNLPGRALPAAAGLLFALLGARDVHRYVRSGLDVPGVMTPERVSRWSIGTIEAVAEAADRLGAPSGASWWPGYFVSAQTGPVPELANDFGLVVAGRLDEPRRRRLHLMDRDELGKRLRVRAFAVVIEGNWAGREQADLLPVTGYRVAATVDTVKVWTPR